MNIQELISLLSNKITHLNDKKTAAFVNGDIQVYDILCKEIEETQKALDKLQN